MNGLRLAMLILLAACFVPGPAMAADRPVDPSSRTNLYFLMKALKARRQAPAEHRYETGRQRLVRKLSNIRFAEIQFDGMTLAEVVAHLREELRKRDPEKRGVNFMFVGTAAAPRDLTQTNAPPVGVAAGSEEVVINQRLPLRNLTALQVLDVVTKNADQPIRFSINDYGIVAMPRAPGSEKVYGSTLRANPDTFQQGTPNVTPRTLPVAGTSQGTQ